MKPNIRHLHEMLGSQSAALPGGSAHTQVLLSRIINLKIACYRQSEILLPC